MITAGLLLFLGAAQPSAPPQSVGLVEIEISGDQTYTIAHTILITSPDIRPARSRDELEQRTWSAMRTSARGADQITSDSCPALATAALAFGELPAIGMTTYGNQVVEEDRSLPAPVMLHGFSSRVKFTAIDGTRVETTGGYWLRKWAHDTITALIGCWGALIPDGSSLPAA